jgi:hypothetical protein
MHWRIIPFLFGKEKESKETARVPRILRVVQPADDAAPRAAMRRWPPARHSSSVFDIAVSHGSLGCSQSGDCCAPRFTLRLA